MINLLSPTIKTERSYGRRNRSLLGYSTVLFFTALAVGGIMVGSLQFIGPDENKLNAEIEDSAIEITLLENTVKPIESVAARLDTAKDISDLSVSFSTLIPEIGAVLPSGIILNALSLTGGITDPLQLDVDLESAGLAPVLIRNLVDSDLFEAADISSITPKGGDSEENASIYKFTASLTASFTGSADAKKQVAAAAAAAAAAQAEAAAEAAKAGTQ